MALGSVSGCIWAAIWFFAFADRIGLTRGQRTTVTTSRPNDSTADNNGHFHKDLPVLEGPASVWTEEGGEAVFICVTKTKQCVGLIWLRQFNDEDDPITIYNPFRDIYQRDKYHVDANRLGCRLTVLNVREDDAGKVICRLYNSDRPYSESAELNVLISGRDPTTENPIRRQKRGRRSADSDPAMTKKRDSETVQKDKKLTPSQKRMKILIAKFRNMDSPRQQFFICSGLSCELCQNLQLPFRIYDNFRYCTRLNYNPLTQTVIVEADVDKEELFIREFPVFELRAICRAWMGVTLCLQIFDVDLNYEQFSGCARVTVNGQLPFEPSCFSISLDPRSRSMVKMRF